MLKIVTRSEAMRMMSGFWYRCFRLGVGRFGLFKLGVVILADDHMFVQFVIVFGS